MWTAGTAACASSDLEDAAAALLQRAEAALALAESAQHQEACTTLQAIAASATQMPDAWLAHEQQVPTLRDEQLMAQSEPALRLMHL